VNDPRVRRCHYCGEPLDPSSRWSWYRVIGWARRGKQGGSDIRLREKYGDDFAHDQCVERERAKIAAGQGTLL
jgi:hypothetical protein